MGQRPDQTANRTYRRASLRDRNERTLRVLASLAAAAAGIWALHGSVTIASSRFRAISIVFALFNCVPLAARCIGWRNRTQPQLIWIRAVAVPVYPLFLYRVSGTPVPALVLASVACLALTVLAGYLLERRYAETGWTTQPR